MVLACYLCYLAQRIWGCFNFKNTPKSATNVTKMIKYLLYILLRDAFVHLIWLPYQFQYLGFIISRYRVAMRSTTKLHVSLFSSEQANM